MFGEEDISVMIGHTITEITGGVPGSTPVDRMVFTTECGDTFEFFHQQDCCERVVVEDIIGDLNDLIGAPIVMVQEVEGDVPDGHEDHGECYQWTFYKFATVKGYVTVRWCGSSNGYYSTAVDFKSERILKKLAEAEL